MDETSYVYIPFRGKTGAKAGMIIPLALAPRGGKAMTERSHPVALEGSPLTVLGPRLRVGDCAREVTLIDDGPNPVVLGDHAEKQELISVVPSLDTRICDLQTRRFDEEAARLGEEIAILAIADLPFAWSRWCGVGGVGRLITRSDDRGMASGDALGTHMEELRLEYRAVFVVYTQ